MLAWKPKSSDPNVASVRYRCLIPLKELEARGFPIALYDPQREGLYDGVVFSKCYAAADQAIARRIKAGGGRVVLDLCDNHFYNPYGLPAYVEARENLLKMIALADIVVCSTHVLADTVTAEAKLSRIPQVVGDPVEFPGSVVTNMRTLPERPVRLVWFGIHASPNAPCGMADIASVAGTLKSTAGRRPWELIVCSNSLERYEREIRPLELPTQYIEYSREAFPLLLSGVDGAILPVNRNPFTWAKSHNRLTTALFAGVPVVADGVPSYREFSDFCVLDDWPRGIEELMSAPQTARERAMAGRDYIEKRWMPSHVADRWSEVLKPVLSNSTAQSSVTK